MAVADGVTSLPEGMHRSSTAGSHHKRSLSYTSDIQGSQRRVSTLVDTLLHSP